MELTLDRMKLLMVYDNLLTLTENIEKSKKPLLSEQPIPLVLRTLKNTLSADKAFFSILKTESSFFRKFNNVDEMLRELEKIQKGTSSIPTRDLTIAVKQISRNVPEFAIALEKQLVNSKKFKEIASKAYPNGTSGSADKKMRDKILNYYEQIGLKPDRVDDLLKRNAGKGKITPTTNSSLGDVLGQGFSQAWRAPSLLKAVFNWRTFVPNTNSKGWQIFMRWLFTGTTRSIPKGISEIYNVLVKNGVSKELAKILAVKVTSVGFEVLKRWVILNGSIFILNVVLTYFMEAGTEEQRKRRDLELDNLAIKDLEDLWGKFGLSWVWPIETVGPAILKTVRGILKRDTPSEIYKQLKSNNLPEQKDAEKLNNEIENAKEDSKLEDFVDDKIEKISSSEKGFKTFLLTKGKKYKDGSYISQDDDYPTSGLPAYGETIDGSKYEFKDNKWVNIS